MEKQPRKSAYNMARPSLFMTLVTLVVAVRLSCAFKSNPNTEYDFNHGVASGDPGHQSIVLWSRVSWSGVKPNVIVLNWVVSESADLKNPARKGQFITHEGRDYTIKIIANGLKSQKPYFYGFSIKNASSPVGRFKLPAPPGQPQAKLTYAVVSCSNWGFGFFNAYDAAAKVKDLDLWVHIGDYIYEYAAGVYPSAAQAVRNTSNLRPQNTIFTLDDYRQRYALYHEDPAAQALRAAAPLVAVWDDHETADNSYVNGSSEHNETTDGPWSVRVSNAVRAYHEWLPTRYLIDDGSYVKIWRSFTFGDLATLAVIETRITARTDSNRQLDTPLPHPMNPSIFSAIGSLVGAQPPSNWTGALVTGIEAVRTKYNTVRNMSNLTIMGNGEQMDWLRQTVAANTTWQLLGQGTVMLEQFGPDFAKAIAMQSDPVIKALWAAQYANLTGDIPNATITGMNGRTVLGSQVKGAARMLQAMGQYHVGYNLDSWAGYQVNKRQVLTTLAGAKNAIIYGGDSHNSWAGVESLDGKPVAAEFDCTGISSPGFESYFGWVPKALMEAGMVAAGGDDGMKYNDINQKGFMLVTLTHAKHHMEFVYVSTITSTNYTAKCDFAVDTMAGATGSWIESACVY